MIKLGTNSIGTLYLGSTKIGKAYLGSNLVYELNVAPEPTPDHACLTFRSSSSNTISLTCNGTAAPVLYYSTDGSTWTQWDYSAVSFSSGHPFFLYGSNTSGFNTGTDDYAQFVMAGAGNVSCSGSIATLINGTNALTTIPSAYCFAHLFDGCEKLITCPTLPSTGLQSYCYWRMFYGTGITEAPALPATTMKQYCYQTMFCNCANLTTPPTLSATSLASYCYRYMFQNCTSLTTAPALPATTLQTYCYGYMFYGCTALVNPPTLGAKTMKNYCYYYMFSGCSSLVNAPALPATTLASYCYQYMFQNCTSLVTAPTLSATTLATYCYNMMFYGCTNLANVQETLPATTLKSNCYNQMFRGCKKLTTAPVLPAITLVTRCYYYMFYGCSALNYVKAMFTTTPSSSYTAYWLANVSSTGTFVKNVDATWTTTGSTGVPTNWTIQTASS